MPSIINRAGVVPEFAEDSDGDMPDTIEPVEVKSKADEIEAHGPEKDSTGGEPPKIES